MKCFLLAAGCGTRLKPITNTVPKCLVPINNKPLLYYWFDLLSFNGINEVFINLHYLPDKVLQHINNYKRELQVTPIMERELLGSFGTLLHNINKFSKEKTLLVCYADNKRNFSIKKLVQFHNSHKYPVTVGLFKTPHPKQCGIIELDKNSNIISFMEKPEKPKSNLANAGIYLVDIAELKKFRINNNILDIAFDFLPHYVNYMKGYLINEFLYDIGNINKLSFANKYVKKHPEEFNLR